MATETLTAIKASMLLNNGTDSQGNVKTTAVSIGTLNPNTWDGDKALAIMDKIENILTKTIVRGQVVRTATLQAS